MKLAMDAKEFDIEGCMEVFKAENEDFKFMKCDLVSFLCIIIFSAVPCCFC